MISSVLNPDVFEPDFRPLIGLLLVIIFSISIVVIKNWKCFRNDFDSDWEL